jgi:PilZ domain
MRYPVKAPVFFTWKAVDGSEHKGEGTSRDISETGAFVLTLVSPPLGADIELRISLPGVLDRTTPEPVQLKARVLRVEHSAEGSGTAGFALLTKRIIFSGHNGSPDKGNFGGIESA